MSNTTLDLAEMMQKQLKLLMGINAGTHEFVMADGRLYAVPVGVHQQVLAECEGWMTIPDPLIAYREKYLTPEYEIIVGNQVHNLESTDCDYWTINASSKIANTMRSRIKIRKGERPKFHTFQLVKTEHGTRIGLKRNDRGGIASTDMEHILHVNQTGNDYCLVEVTDDNTHMVWDGTLSAGKKVLLASIHGTGEIRWTVDPTTVQDYRDGKGAGIPDADLDAILKYWYLDPTDL